MTCWYSGFPCSIPNTPRHFRGYNDAGAPLYRITMHHCIGLLWGLLRPVNPYPYGFDVNYIITLSKSKAEYVPMARVQLCGFIFVPVVVISDLHLILGFCIITHATTRSVGRVVMQQIANL